MSFLKRKILRYKEQRINWFSMNKSIAPLCFVILDGFGIAPVSPNNAITSAKTPTFDLFKHTYPYTILQASGEAVGLPPGYVGNSEVGHTTIGAGRIIEQPLTRINNAIADKNFFDHPLFDLIKKQVNQKQCRVHIMGLLSDAGVHCHIEHFFATLRALAMRDIADVFIHPILDGRDATPCSASYYLAQLDECISQYKTGKIATLHGRLYAMDRDKNWERTKLSYDALTIQQTNQATSWYEIIKTCGINGLSEEFLKPVQLIQDAIVHPNDIFLFLNYREDRACQLAKALTESEFNDFDRSVVVPIELVTPFAYDSINSQVFYTQKQIKNSLKEVCSNNNKTVTVIAETEKFAHVTYFLSCGRHESFPGETQILIPSLKYERYDGAPVMRAAEITQCAIEIDKHNESDLYVINYANADMVGHSGNFAATVQAIEILDAQMAILYNYFVLQQHGVLVISADHGKAEYMYDPIQKNVITGHTINPVPFFFITNNKKYRAISICHLKGLKDISPFLLKILNLSISSEMRS